MPKKFGLSAYTLEHFFDEVVRRYADRPALARVGEEPCTYAELGDRVAQVRQRLEALGVVPRSRVALLGPSSPEWAVAFLAVTTMGAVAVPVLDEFPEADVDHVIAHADVAAVLMGRRLFETLTLPALARDRRLVVALDDLEVLAEGREPKAWEQMRQLPDRVRRAWQAPDAPPEEPVTEDDLAEIIYTSGTTGHSKGVMLTHGNLVSNLFEGPDMLGVIDEQSVILAFLPLAHAFGSTSGFLSIIYRGAAIYFLGRKPAPKILLGAMEQVRPTIIGAVPLIFEKIYQKQVQPVLREHPVLRHVARTAFGRRLVHRLAGRKINEAFGGRLDCAIIGGAGLNSDVERFLREGGVPYAVGYGLTECSPLVTFSAVHEAPLGSVGRAITDVQIRIDDPDPATGVGEILVKGPNVMRGYYKNEAATRAAFTEDGWLVTGDRGYLDDDGYLFIRGRSKNVIVGPSGENIYPEVVEEKLNGQPGVEESIVYEREGRLVARVLPDYTYFGDSGDEAATAERIDALLETVRRAANAQLGPSSRIHRIIEQPEPFVKTATNKIKRYLYVDPSSGEA